MQTNITDLTNVFLCYYKQLFNKSTETTGFHDIDPTDNESTNRFMELFYEAIHKYKTNKQSAKSTVYDAKHMDQIDIEKCDELYILVIDNKYNKACELLLPLIIHVSKMDNWGAIEWSINSIKLHD